jgi:Protein of unknown function (DUF2934)
MVAETRETSAPVPMLLSATGNDPCVRRSSAALSSTFSLTAFGGGNPVQASNEEATMADSDERIREIAYYIWENEGRPEGQADRHWRTAEEIVQAQEAEGTNAEGEPPPEQPSDYVTPLAVLKRGSSSSGSG